MSSSCLFRICCVDKKKDKFVSHLDQIRVFLRSRHFDFVLDSPWISKKKEGKTNKKKKKVKKKVNYDAFLVFFALLLSQKTEMLVFDAGSVERNGSCCHGSATVNADEGEFFVGQFYFYTDIFYIYGVSWRWKRWFILLCCVMFEEGKKILRWRRWATRWASFWCMIKLERRTQSLRRVDDRRLIKIVDNEGFGGIWIIHITKILENGLAKIVQGVLDRGREKEFHDFLRQFQNIQIF